MTTLRPSQVKARPEQFSPDTPCTVRAPLGEIDTMALPISLFGLKDAIRMVRIGPSDRFNAQGLEGAFEIDVPWCRAYVLVAKCAEYRAVVRISAHAA